MQTWLKDLSSDFLKVRDTTIVQGCKALRLREVFLTLLSQSIVIALNLPLNKRPSNNHQ